MHRQQFIVLPIGSRRQKKQLSAPELSAAKYVCMRKTGLARYSAGAIGPPWAFREHDNFSTDFYKTLG